MPSIDRLYPPGPDTILSSDWTGLSPHLIATFYPMRPAEGNRWERIPGSTVVQAPLTEGQIEQTQNWSSPFENSGVEAKLGTFSAMLQSGSFGAILNALQEKTAQDSWVGGKLGELSAGVESLRGLSGVTKMNSTQTYTGSPPLRLTFTAHFRALFDAVAEVRAPLNQLVSWAMPEKLAEQGVVANTVSKGPGIRSVYASNAPQIIGVQYADSTWRPMVIESVSTPLTGPRDRDGTLITTSVQLVIGSLTALDQRDWAEVYRGRS